MQEERSKGVQFKEVESGGIAFHTPNFEVIKEEIIKAIDEVIPPKERPINWISSTYSVDEQPEVIDGHYFYNNLANPVHFSEVIAQIPHGSAVLEISGL